MPRDPDSTQKQPLASSLPPRQPLDEGSDPISSTSSTHHQDEQRNTLRTWLHSDVFNAPDGLDDYDQDYNTFQPLKDIITADMRHHINRRKQGDRDEQEPRKINVANTDSSAASELSAEACDRKCHTPLPAAAEMVLPHTEPPTLKLDSYGRLAIIGSEDQVVACAKRLGDRLNCILLVKSDAPAGCRQITLADGLILPLVYGQIIELSGFLGKFSISIMMDNEKRPVTTLSELNTTGIDLVLDLASPPLIRCERLPLGYFAPGTDSEALNQTLDMLPDMVGEFEKPGFISEAPDLCAHHRSRFRGCNRCISSCPADAIRSNGDGVGIDHHLCQGCGLCAAVCPTGALVNGRLQSTDILSQIRHELKASRSDAAVGRAVVFHEPETESALLARICTEFAAPAIQLAVDDIASIGMDIWFAALAYGAERVILVPSPQTTPGMRRTIETQIGYARDILQGMGYTNERIILTDDALPQSHHQLSKSPGKAAIFSPMLDRRRLVRSSIEHLYDQSPRERPSIPLPSGAPFGIIRIDKSACTFCLACAQVCPTSALSGGSDQPQIKMIEARCIQCGLCRRACPEKAVTLHARMVFERNVSEDQQTLIREESFHCIGCGKPFAPARLVERMAERLSDHWMYGSQQERERLKMCRDCRLQDIFSGQHSKEDR
ncbi:MAG: 4Fe-4S binding protein [Desulfobacterales bacterium]|jgi:ferredoxin